MGDLGCSRRKKAVREREREKQSERGRERERERERDRERERGGERERERERERVRERERENGREKERGGRMHRLIRFSDRIVQDKHSSHKNLKNINICLTGLTWNNYEHFHQEQTKTRPKVKSSGYLQVGCNDTLCVTVIWAVGFGIRKMVTKGITQGYI